VEDLSFTERTFTEETALTILQAFYNSPRPGSGGIGWPGRHANTTRMLSDELFMRDKDTVLVPARIVTDY
jgi:hypothetical protein